MKEENRQMSKQSGLLKKLYPYIEQYKSSALFSILCVSIESVLELIIPLIMADIVDIGIKNGDVSFILGSGLKMLIFALVSLVSGVAASYFAAKASRGFGANLRSAQFKKVQELSFANLDTNIVGNAELSAKGSSKYFGKSLINSNKSSSVQ